MPSLQVVYRCAGALAVLAAGLAGACSAGSSAIQRPRPLVVFSGARLQPDSARLDSIDAWVQELDRTITEDPTFVVLTETVPQAAYPWETLEFFEGQPDTVRVAIEAGSDAGLPFRVYGFLHLMKRHGRLGEFFPEAADLEGYDLERFIVGRTTDSWLLGRSVYDTQPYEPLDELAYAQDRGYLDAFLFAARPGEFSDVRESWMEDHPGEIEEFRTWFRETFNRAPPGPEGG